MRREESTDERGRVEGDAGASFDGRVARSKEKKSAWYSGSWHTVFGPVKEMFTESVERCGGWECENRLCAGIGVASVQGR